MKLMDMAGYLITAACGIISAVYGVWLLIWAVLEIKDNI